jgi:hypothetical protein
MHDMNRMDGAALPNFIPLFMRKGTTPEWKRKRPVVACWDPVEKHIALEYY